MATKTRFSNWKRGFNGDTPRNQLRDDEVREANNVVYRAGDWEKRPGYTQPYTATGDADAVIEVADYIEDGASTLLCATTNNIYYLNGTTWTDRLALTPTGDVSNKWFFAEIAGVSYASNGVDNIYQSTNPSTTNYTAITWDTATVGSSTGTTVTRANSICTMNNRLWMGGVTDGTDGQVDFRLRFTNANDFNRTEGGTGYYDEDVTQTAIMAITPTMNNGIVLFKEDMVSIVQNTGNPIVSPVLRFRPGILSPKSFCHLPNGSIWYVSKYGFHLFQNGLPEDVGRNRVREWFFANLYRSEAYNVYCWADMEHAEVHNIFSTATGEPDKDIVYNWSTGAFYTWDMDAYCGLYRDREQTATNRYYGSASGIVKLSGGTTDNGTAITSRLITKSYDHRTLMNLHRPVDASTAELSPNYIQANRIYSDARPATTTFYFGTQDYGTETPTFTNSAALTDTNGYQPVANIDPTTSAYLVLQIDGFTNISEVTAEWSEAGDL